MGSRSRLSSWLRRRFRPLAAVLTLAGLALALHSQRDAIETLNWRLDRVLLLGSVLLLAVAPLLQGASFWLTLRYLGVRAAFTDALLVWTRSFLLRYAPTGALAPLYRVRERERLGATTAQVLTATGYEQLVALTAGAIVCVGAFAGAGLRPPLIALVLCGAAVSLSVALTSYPRGRWLSECLERRGVDTAALLRGRQLAALCALSTAGWVATGLGNYVLIGALVGGARIDPFFLTGAFALAWMLGFLVPLPGGLGMRDGTLVVFLAGSFATGVATALTLALRLVSTLAEFVAIALAELVHAAASRRHRAAPGPAERVGAPSPTLAGPEGVAA